MLRSITGCCVSHIEKVARSDGGVEKHHLNQSVYIRYLTPSPYTPPISSAMSRGRVEFILLRGVFVAQKYRGDTEKTIVSEERVWNIQGQSPLIIDWDWIKNINVIHFDENKRVMKFLTLFVARPGHDPGTFPILYRDALTLRHQMLNILATLFWLYLTLPK